MHAQAEAATTAPQADFGQVTVYPILGYRDLEAAIDWLIRVFSFEPLAVYKNEQGDFVHIELRLGDGVIMPTRFNKDGDSDNPWSRPIATQGIYVGLDGLDSHYERAVAEGAEVFRPLADTAYGSREYSARDLEGNLWSFGTYRPRLD
jgi:uncharacterized glyoxalase superfamily protein PhnB